MARSHAEQLIEINKKLEELDNDLNKFHRARLHYEEVLSS